MERYADWVKANNNIDKSRYIVSVIGFVCTCFLYVTLFADKEINYIIIGGVIIVVAALSCNKYFFKRYLNIEQNVEYTDISKIMCYHSFDIDEYFNVIKVKMKKHTSLIGIYVFQIIMLFIFGNEGREFEWWKFLSFSLIGIVLIFTPYISYYCQKWIFSYKMRKGIDGKFKIILKALSAIGLLADSLLWIVVACLALLIGWVVFGSLVTPEVIESKIVFRNRTYMQSILFLIIGGFGMLLLTMEDGMRAIGKKLYRIAFAICICLMIVGMALTVREQNIYTEFADDRFIIYNFGIKAEYGMEDIDTFSVYIDEDRAGIQLELTFKDGVNVKTLGTSITCSDLYTNTYKDENEFVEDYVKTLKSRGIDGTVEDIEFENIK